MQVSFVHTEGSAAWAVALNNYIAIHKDSRTESQLEANWTAGQRHGKRIAKGSFKGLKRLIWQSS